MYLAKNMMFCYVTCNSGGVLRLRGADSRSVLSADEVVAGTRGAAFIFSSKQSILFSISPIRFCKPLKFVSMVFDIPEYKNL